MIKKKKTLIILVILCLLIILFCSIRWIAIELVNSGDTYAKEGKYQEALDRYRKAKRILPDESLKNKIALIEEHLQGIRERANELYNDAQKDNKNRNYYFALKKLAKAQELYPDNPDITKMIVETKKERAMQLFAIAIKYKSEYRYKDTFETLFHAQELYPDSTDISNLIAETEKEAERAERLFIEVKPFFNEANEEIHDLSIKAMEYINPQKLLIVVRGYLRRQILFGIFILDAKSEKYYMTVDTLTNDSQTFLLNDFIVEEASGDQLVFLIDAYRALKGKIKYFYDINERTVIKKINYYPLEISSIVEFNGDLYLIGNFERKYLGKTIISRLEYIPDNNTVTYDVVESITGRTIGEIHEVRTEHERLILTHNPSLEREEWKGPIMDYILHGGMWSIDEEPALPIRYRQITNLNDEAFNFIKTWKPIDKVEDNIIPICNLASQCEYFFVINRGIHSSLRWKNGTGIYVASGKTRNEATNTFYRIPDQNYEMFAKYRPERVLAGYTREIASIGSRMGPCYYQDKKIWFGTSFYDGEGSSGIGGLGYFDVDKKEYVLNYYKETIDWSASAIYADNEYVWMGLIMHPEGRNVPGGLIRFNLKNEQIDTFDIPHIINAIYKFKNVLYFGTSDGVYVFSEGRLRQVAVSKDLNGNYYWYVRDTID